MDGTLFNYLFEGAKSSKQERVEDFVTELLGFMWEIDSKFKEGLLSYLKKKIDINNFEFDSPEFLTQETVVKSDSGTLRYDMVIEDNKNRKIIIENKIGSKDNQFLKYIKLRNTDEILFLLIPKKYEHAENIESKFIIYWEDLILYLKPFLEIENERNNTLKQIRKSFFNYLFDYAGLYYDVSSEINDKFLQMLNEKIKSENQKKNFLKHKELVPFGKIDSELEPYFGIEIEDFYDKTIHITLVDTITKIKKDKKEHEEEIKILNSNKYNENITIFEKEESDNSFFSYEIGLDNNLSDIKRKFTEFIKEFYEDDPGETIIEGLDEFMELIRRLIGTSGNEKEFKENIIRYYIFLKKTS